MSPEIGAALLGVVGTLIAAFVGRTTWTWSRKRFPKRSTPLRFGTVNEDASFAASDIVKIVDLRGSPGGNPQRGVVQLYDCYQVERIAPGGDGLVSLYSTSGDLEGVSVSHPLAFKWGRNDSRHRASNFALAVPLETLAEGVSTKVINRLVYTGGFDSPDKESIEAHVDRATRSLTFILLFSAGYPCESVSGYRVDGTREEIHLVEKNRPTPVEDGQLVYWRIVPDKGEWLPIEVTYLVEWNWGSRTTASPR